MKEWFTLRANNVRKFLFNLNDLTEVFDVKTFFIGSFLILWKSLAEWV